MRSQSSFFRCPSSRSGRNCQSRPSFVPCLSENEVDPYERVKGEAQLEREFLADNLSDEARQHRKEPYSNGHHP